MRTFTFIGLSAGALVSALTFTMILSTGCGPNWIVPVETTAAADAGTPCFCSADGGDDGEAPDSGTPSGDAGTPSGDAGTPSSDAGTPGTDAGTPGSDGGVCDAGTPPPPTCKAGFELGNDGKCHKDTCKKVEDDDKCECDKPGHGKGKGHCKEQHKKHSQGHGNGHCKYDCED